MVTLGEAFSRRIAELFSRHRYRDYLHLHGLAVEAAEAAAELVHGLICQELGLVESRADREAAGRDRPRRQGARYSPGYPSFPDLQQQRVLFDLLQPERIGVELTETAQMVPEHSVSAIVAHHPAARQFAV